MPVPPHAHRETPQEAAPHPVIAAAYAAARGSASGDTGGDRAAPPVPARHKAPLRPPSRRAWVAVGLLIALTALPTLVVILAGRAALHGPDDPQPYRADGRPPVVVEPGPDGANRHNDAAVAPEVVGGVTPSAPTGVGGVGGGRAEATPCPTVSGSAGAAGGAASGAGAAAGGGGAPPAGAGSSGSGSTGDGGSGAQGAPPAPGGGGPGGAPGGVAAPGGGAPSGGDGSAGGDHGSHDRSHDSGSHDSDEPDDDPPPQSGGGSNESAPGRNFIERVFDELGIPIP